MVASLPTSIPTPNSLLALSVAGAKIALVNETKKVPLQTKVEVKSLFRTRDYQHLGRPKAIEVDLLGGALPVVGMHGIFGFIKLDCVIFGVGKGWWDGFPHSHR